MIRDADEYGELFSGCASQHSTTTPTTELHALKFVAEGGNAMIIGKPDHAT